MGLDDPAFIPTGTFYDQYGYTVRPGSEATYAYLGFNANWGNPSGWQLDRMQANHVGGAPDNYGAAFNMACIVGFLVGDEIPSWSGFTGPFARAPSAYQDIRPWLCNDYHRAISGSSLPSGCPVGNWTQILAYQFTTRSARQRKIDMFSVDVYFFAGTVDWGYMNGAMTQMFVAELDPVV